MAPIRRLAAKKRRPPLLVSRSRRKTFLLASRRAPEEFDEYISDPAKPVPVTGEIGEGMPGDYMTYDQRFASRRTDVLTYETEPLKHDVTIAGPVTPVLRVSTSGTDSDFIVKLIDVYPNDTPDPDPNPQRHSFWRLSADWCAGSRSGANSATACRSRSRSCPANRRRSSSPCPTCCTTFEAGHRIMVQIQSSWFPMVDRNPQQFEDIPTAKASDFQKAVERVYRGGADGTRIDVLVL